MRRTSRISSSIFATLLTLSMHSALRAQGNSVVTVKVPPKLAFARGATEEARITVQLQSGYHMNSHQPADEYLIPLRLTWEPKPFEIAGVSFPKPEFKDYSFSPKPVSVFTGDFDISTRLKVPANASRGPGILLGKLRYQACTDSMCLPPRTTEVRLLYEIR